MDITRDLYLEERRQAILELVNRDGRVAVAELSATFGVSEVTIRAELQALAERNLLVRTHGGAVPGQSEVSELALAMRRRRHVGEKSRIGRAGAEDSWQMLYQAAEAKCDFPGQVHFLLANHDLAQIHGEGIMKSGLSVCEAFNAAVKRDFGERATLVIVTITEFLLTLPLAIRCPNGLFFCHSLPPDEQIKTFDYSVFERDPLKPEDYRRRTGPVYQLIWGRKVTPAGVEEFAQKVGAKLIVTGHQPQEAGYAINGERHLIIASDHNQGVFLPLSLSEEYDMSKLTRRLRKLVALGSNDDE